MKLFDESLEDVFQSDNEGLFMKKKELNLFFPNTQMYGSLEVMMDCVYEGRQGNGFDVSYGDHNKFLKWHGWDRCLSVHEYFQICKDAYEENDIHMMHALTPQRMLGEYTDSVIIRKDDSLILMDGVRAWWDKEKNSYDVATQKFSAWLKGKMGNMKVGWNNYKDVEGDDGLLIYIFRNKFNEMHSPFREMNPRIEIPGSDGVWPLYMNFPNIGLVKNTKCFFRGVRNL